MEEEKRKRKRKKYAKCKSKSLCIETPGYKSKNIKIPNGKANTSTLGRCKKGKVLDIRSDQKGSAYQSIQHLKHKYNRSKKRRKRMRTEKSNSLAVKTSDFKDNFVPYVGGYSTGINSSNMVSKLNTTANNVNLKAGSFSSKKLGLKEKLKNKLESGRFRWINEKLYTTNSSSALKMFEVEPELFKIYHQGFSSQVQKWPVNPVDTMIDWIMKRSPQMIIADMGCGEAKIAQSVPNKVFSFDLVSVNDFVTACDMSKVPLADESVDIVIYCLSLMGTNLNDFLQEARRILKSDGILKIAEVVSRFECLSSFEETVCCFGFKLLTKDTTNKMFAQFEFKKVFKIPDQKKALPLSLKPCLYKRR